MLVMTWWNRPGLKEFDGILCDGAVRSGKTVSMVIGFFLWSMASFSGGTFAICGKTVGALRRNMITHLEDWLGDLFQIRESYSEHLIKVKTVVTLVVTAVFAVLSLRGTISPDNVMIIISMVVSFYFGTQHEKK